MLEPMVLTGTLPRPETAQTLLSEPPLRTFASAHLVGICGSGMKALAELLGGLGCRVSGSDLHPAESAVERLRQRGWRVHAGHDSQYLHDPDVLIYSPAIGPQNPERIEAARRGIPQLSYSQMLGHLMRNRVGISIAGTHGKSTTTAMTASVLASAGLDASAIVGAELIDRGVSGWAGEGRHFVVESCEYLRSFLNLSPQYAAILGIESDHFDYFSSLDATIAAFAEFAERVPADGLLVVHRECEASLRACAGATAELQTYSLEPGADWWAADLRPTRAGLRFRVFHRGEFFSEVSLQIPGRHTVLNTLAAIALCYRAGADADAIREGLVEFSGIHRRFEYLGSWRGVTLIDDYAHHPTAIRATLQTARERAGDRRLWCVFQPHQVSRTQALIEEFATSFSAADQVLITPVYGARETYENELAEVSADLAGRVVANGVAARFSPSLDRTIRTLEDELRPGDVLLTMGAGTIDQVHHAFTRRLQRHYSPR